MPPKVLQKVARNFMIASLNRCYNGDLVMELLSEDELTIDLNEGHIDPYLQKLGGYRSVCVCA